MTKDKKVKRDQTELLKRLRDHVSLLETYIVKAFEENDKKYLGEVAGKLRLLVYRSPTNRPLLLDLMQKTKIRVTVKTNDRSGGPIEITLEDQLNKMVCIVMTPTQRVVELTYIQYLSAWAQQHGAAHEDWALDEGFYTALTFPRTVGELPISSAALRDIATVVLSIANDFLKQVSIESVSLPEVPRLAVEPGTSGHGTAPIGYRGHAQTGARHRFTKRTEQFQWCRVWRLNAALLEMVPRVSNSSCR